MISVMDIPKPETIWRENDSRFDRHIKVLETEATYNGQVISQVRVRIRTCDRLGLTEAGPKRWVRLSGFGKRYLPLSGEAK